MLPENWISCIFYRCRIAGTMPQSNIFRTCWGILPPRWVHTPARHLMPRLRCAGLWKSRRQTGRISPCWARTAAAFCTIRYSASFLCPCGTPLALAIAVFPVRPALCPRWKPFWLPMRRFCCVRRPVCGCSMHPMRVLRCRTQTRKVSSITPSSSAIITARHLQCAAGRRFPC